MSFLLKVCSELIDVDVDILYRSLLVVQEVFCESTLTPVEVLSLALGKED